MLQAQQLLYRLRTRDLYRFVGERCFGENEAQALNVTVVPKYRGAQEQISLYVTN